MKTEYIFVVLGIALALWAQFAFADSQVYVRIFLTAVGIAIAGSAFEIAKKAKKGDK